MFLPGKGSTPEILCSESKPNLGLSFSASTLSLKDFFSEHKETNQKNPDAYHPSIIAHFIAS